MNIRPLLGSVAILLCVANGATAQDPPTRDSTPPERPRRQRVVTDLSGFDLLDSLSLARRTIVVSATRGADPPVALAPRIGRAYSTRPIFSWKPGGGVESFTFTLWTEDQEEVFKTQVTGTRFEYPADAPPLQPGKAYVWSVAPAVTLLGGSASLLVGIMMATTDQRQSIERELEAIDQGDPVAAGLERARVFTRSRVWYDVIAEYTDLIARFPDRAELYEERGMVYAQLEATQDLADADFMRADELGGTKER